MIKIPIEKKKLGKISKIKGSVPAFLLKTYEILEDNKCSDIISWNKDGTAFIVKKVNEFSEEILPKYFKHNNFASFVRQLNMYDFHKTRKQNNGNEFRHALFRRSEKHLLGEIKRKATTIVSSPSYDSEELSVVKKKKKLAPISNYTFRKNVESLEEKFKQVLKNQKKTELILDNLSNENKQLWHTNRRLMINIMTKKKNENLVEQKLSTLIGEVIEEADANDQLQLAKNLVGQKKTFQIQFPEDFNHQLGSKMLEDDEEKCEHEARREHSDTTLKHPQDESESSPALSESDLSLSSATKKISNQQGLKTLLANMLMKLFKKTLKRKINNLETEPNSTEFEQPSTEKKRKLQSSEAFIISKQKMDPEICSEPYYSFQETYLKPHNNKLFFQEPAMLDYKFEPAYCRDELLAPREIDMAPPFQSYQNSQYQQENVDVSHLYNLYIRNDY